MPKKDNLRKKGSFPAYKRVGTYAKILGVVAGFLPFVFLLYLVSIGVVSGATGVPSIVSYQGRLTNPGGDLLGGAGTNYYFKFSIWDDTVSTSTVNRVWPSSGPGIATSTVANGVFNVNIGDTANNYPDALTYDFYQSKDVYLQVEVSENGTDFETLSPRQRISASGFAINANTLSGKLRASSTADYTFDVINDNPTGRANLNTEGQVRVGSFSAPPTTIGGGSLYYNSATGQVFIWNDVTTTPQWVSLGGASGGSTDLQSAYNLGNVIQTTSNRDILFTLAPAATSSNFIVNISATSTGVFQIQASSSAILTFGRNAVTSTAALSWNIQGSVTLATTTIGNGPLNISLGSLLLGNTTRIDNLGQATLTTSTISVLTVNTSSSLGGVTTFANATGTGLLSLTGAGDTPSGHLREYRPSGAHLYQCYGHGSFKP